MEEQLATSLSERQVTELVEYDEVEAAEVIGSATLAAGSCLSVELVDQIDDIEEAATSTAANAGAGDADSQVRLARACAADQHQIALTCQVATAGEVAHQGFVDWRVGEDELVDLLGERQLRDGQLCSCQPKKSQKCQLKMSHFGGDSVQLAR